MTVDEDDLTENANWYVFVDGRRRAENPFFQKTWNLNSLTKNQVIVPAADGDGADIDPFGVRHEKTLAARPIPQLYRKERSFADWEGRTIPADTTTSRMISAGELTTGYFRIGFAGGRDAEVEMTYTESYYKKMNREEITKVCATMRPALSRA